MFEGISGILWAVVTVLILLSSCYFTVKLKFVQFDFKEMMSNLFKKNKTYKGITPFQSLMMTLGARIGVGSIAGVAIAIYLGGPGSLFWMWITAILAATNSFAETVLGIRYQCTDENGMNVGGPSYYIRDGLKKKKLGSLYAVLVILSYVGGYVSIQASTITHSLRTFTNIPSFLIGILICFVTVFVIYGGLKNIASFIEKMVPATALIYLFIGGVAFVKNFSLIPDIFYNILYDAFTFKSCTSGIIGGIVIGIQRAIFSNEAGLGTCSISSSASSNTNAASHGYLQMIGIYITTFLICTATAVIILTSNYQSINFFNINGIEIAQYAFTYHFGYIGGIILFVSIVLFSLSSILTGYYDGESSLRYFFSKMRPIYIVLLKTCTLFVLFLGSIISPSAIWIFVDIFTAIFAIINIYAIIKLRNVVNEEYRINKRKKCDKIK